MKLPSGALGELCGEKFEPYVCPAYMVTRPVVEEVCSGLQAYQQGEFWEANPDATEYLWEGVQLAFSAFKKYEGDMIEKAAKERERERKSHG